MTMTLRDDLSSSAVSCTLVSCTLPAGTCAADGAAGSPPKPPKTTFQIDRFIARHMIALKIAPDEPTSAPVMINRSFDSMKPAAAAAQPEELLSSDTTTGMSPPP